MVGELLASGVDPVAFSNVQGLTPSMWRTRDTKEWRTKREAALVSEEALARNADYIISATVDIVMAIQASRLARRAPAFEIEEAVAVRDDVEVFEKADRRSVVVGVIGTASEIMVRFEVDAIDGSEQFCSIFAEPEPFVHFQDRT